MTATQSTAPTPARGAPWHLWVVGVVSLLWNAFGGFDYTMSQLQGDAYLQSAGMTPEQIEYFHAMPAWMTAVWAVGVWGAVAGSLLLLARSRWAYPMFSVSFGAFALSLLYQFVLSDGAAHATSMQMVMSAIIAAACLCFIWYSRLMLRAGVLR